MSSLFWDSVWGRQWQFVGRDLKKLMEKNQAVAFKLPSFEISSPTYLAFWETSVEISDSFGKQTYKKNWIYDSIMTIMLRNGCFSSIIARRSKKIKLLFFVPHATAKMGPSPCVRIYINTWRKSTIKDKIKLNIFNVLLYKKTSIHKLLSLSLISINENWTKTQMLSTTDKTTTIK